MSLPSPIFKTITTKKTVEKDNEETIFSIGLRFSFGDMAPEIVGGVRNTNTDKNSDVTGVQGDIAIPLSGANQFKPKVRVLGLSGNRDYLGQAGVGFNFGSNQPMFSAGVQGTNVEGGFNLGLDGTFDPYAGLNLFGEPAAPKTKVIKKKRRVLVGRPPQINCPAANICLLK